MDLLANDLSIHEQFHDRSSFRGGLERLMAMRSVAQRFGWDVYCHRGLLTANPMPNMSMQQAIGHLAVESERRAAMGWLTRGGPFWDDLRRHDVDDYLECQGEVVTESAVGEAAFRTLHSVECGLVSVTPSDWDFSPVEVTWRRDAEGLETQHTHLDNWRDVVALEEILRNAAPPIRSWDDLRESSANRFKSLTFAGDCFARFLQEFRSPRARRNAFSYCSTSWTGSRAPSTRTAYALPKVIRYTRSTSRAKTRCFRTRRKRRNTTSATN